MTTAEIIQKVENTTDIIDLSVKGIKIWRYERFAVNRFLSEKDGGKEKLGLTRELKNFKIKNLIKYVKLYMKYKETPVVKSDILIFNHSRRAWNEKEKTYDCKYTEKLSDYYKSTTTYEAPFSDGHIEPTHTPNLRYLDRIIIRSYIYEVLNRKLFKKQYSKDYNTIKQYLTNVMSQYYDDKTIDQIAKSMTKNLYLIYYRRKSMRKIIKKVSPKVIIEVVGYSRNNMVVNEVAKEMGIPTIELQHSQISDVLLQYMWNGRNDIEQFPDYLFTYGDFWSHGIQAPIPSENVKAVGFPYFEEQMKLISDKNNGKQSGDSVLFVSQYLAGKYVYELAIKVSQICPDINIIYKLHPEEYGIWETRYPELKKFSNINVITDVNVSLYECFTKVNAVVGVYSGALYEALAFDLPVYLYNVNYIEHMKKLIDVDGAMVFNSAEELMGVLKEGKRMDTPKLEIWKKDSWNNLVREVDAIMGER